MKTLKTLEIGDKIEHYCAGELVEATVIERRGNSVITEYAPIRYGNDIYKNTTIMPSLPLQMPTCETTPGAFINGKRLKL